MPQFDAIVIGSGAGGAPVAERLARSGMKVLMLERGKRHNKQDFADRDEIGWSRRDKFVPSILTDPHTRRWDEGQKANPTTDGWISSMLGGGTVHMSGFWLPMQKEDTLFGSRLANEKAHTAIDWAVPFEDFVPYYKTLDEEMGVSGEEGGMPALTEHPLSKSVETTAKKLGIAVRRTPRAILTVPRPDEDRQSCAYRLTCASYGCPTDARGSMLVTYIRRGEKTGNLTIWTQALATKILKGADGRASGVVVQKLADGSEVTVSAGIVVVAASAVESARLLLLSGDGFNPNGQVGKNLWFHLYVDVNGYFPKAKFPEVMSGSPFIHRTLNWGVTLPKEQQAKLNIDRAGTLDVLWQHDNPISRAERIALEGGLVWGKELKTKLHDYFTGGRGVLVEAFAEQVPHPGAYIDLDPETKDKQGMPVARITHWHHPRDKRVADEIGRLGLNFVQELGAENARIRVALGETLILQGGTCRFGNDPRNSVITPNGNLHGVPNVYVTDGGALPSSGTSPTTKTIIANSLRTADKILASVGSKPAVKAG